jgi:hypothetical protein
MNRDISHLVFAPRRKLNNRVPQKFRKKSAESQGNDNRGFKRKIFIAEKIQVIVMGMGHHDGREGGEVFRTKAWLLEAMEDPELLGKIRVRDQELAVQFNQMGGVANSGDFKL